jgi:hypothetical protein
LRSTSINGKALALLWLLGAIAVGVLVLYLTLFVNLRLGLVLLVGLLAIVLLTVASTARASMGYATGSLLIIGASSTAVSSVEGAAVFSVALRVIGFGVIILLASRASATAMAHPDTRPRRKWIYVIGASLGAYFIVGAAFHGQIVTFVLYSTGLVLLLVTVVRSEGAADPALRLGLVLGLGILVGSSLLYGLGAPSAGYENGRLRGFMENSNTLGFFAFLLGAAALLLVRKIRWRSGLLLLAFAVLVLTASRASALALALVMAVLLIRRGILSTVGVVVGSGLAVALAYTFDPSLFDPFSSLLRFNDSRSDSTATAIEAFVTNPLIGVGVGNESSIIASSPFRALAQAGIVGLVAVVAIWMALLTAGARRGAPAFALAVAAVVHSIFEGWLLSPVSPLLAIFLVLWIAVLRDARPSPAQQSAPYLRPGQSRAPETFKEA